MGLLTAPLNSLSNTDLPLAGGKAANLGELIHGGFRVPQGFLITTISYDRFVEHNGLDETISRFLAENPPNDEAIRNAFESAPIPTDVEQSIIENYQQLGKGPVAVRSSATAEDLPEAAFAGQQDTYLNIIGEEALLEAVRRCWASLWTGRAIAYRQHQGIDQGTVKLAVVVQCMVEAESAGVMFTANPVTGARDEVVIDASPGLGEAVVSGLVTPDHFTLRKGRPGWRIIERRAGRREMIVQSRPGGGTEHIEGTAAGKNTSVPDPVLIQLAHQAEAIQHHFGGPQDVEWAWADGKLWILQARPITALPTPPPRANRLQRLIASNFGELFAVRPYPLDMSTWIPALGGALEPIFILMGFEWRLPELFEEEDGIVTRLNNQMPRPTWKLLTTPLRLLSLILRYDPLQWQADPLLLQAITTAHDLESRDFQTLSWKQLLDNIKMVKDLPVQTAGELRRRYFPGAVFAMLRLRILLTGLRKIEKTSALLSGAENQTLTANRALEDLAQQVRSDSDLARIFTTTPSEKLWDAVEENPGGRIFLDNLAQFLDRFGHREAVISTALQPTWKDAPEVVLGIIRSFAAHSPQPEPLEPAWQTARDEIIQHPLLKLAPLQSAFLKTLEQARVLFQIREDTHFYTTLCLPIYRRTFMEMGRRLVRAGLLTDEKDVFHLRLEELEGITNIPPAPEQMAELVALVEQRKARRSELDDVPLVDPRLFFQSDSISDALLRGMPGSPGVAEGPARIIRDGYEFDKLVPGDVLVAPYTNPSWTPLFQRAVAVVVDSGSLGSHAAIVAREYGIPAVMSTVNGTSVLQDGEHIHVDGSQGFVSRVDRTIDEELRKSEGPEKGENGSDG